MKHLVLYIDKWYISGVVVDDGVPRPLLIPNQEDRIWLYFYIDPTDNKVSFSKGYRSNALSAQLHYYTDIFSKLPESEDATYCLYGHRMPMKNIFRDAEIIECLKTPFEGEDVISTFISFSPDIDIVPQSVFLKTMRESGFEINVHSADIEQLVLEYGIRNCEIMEEGYILALTACNENLHYSVFLYRNNGFIFKETKSLIGYGVDCRGKALMEHVVSGINTVTKILVTNEEEEHEQLYLSGHVDEWLRLIDNSPAHLPVDLGPIGFSKQPNNTIPISIQKKDLDKRTNVVVEDVVNEIFRTLATKDIQVYDIKYIVALGDMFNNVLFRNKLLNKVSLRESNVVHYKEGEIPNIISVYPLMDRAQFAEEELKFDGMASEAIDMAKAKKAKKDADAQKLIEEAERKKKKEEGRETQHKFDLAMTHAQQEESNKDWQQALEYYKTADALLPGQESVQRKIEEMKDYLQRESIKSEQYNNAYKKAKEYFAQKQWNDALRLAEQALSYLPESKEAQRIVDDCMTKIKQYERAKELFTRAEAFESQGDYERAIDELEQISLFAQYYPGLQEKLSLLIEVRKKIQKEIEELESNMVCAEKDVDYQFAIQYCEQLVEKTGLSKWNSKLLELRQKAAEKAKQAKQIESLKKQLEEARQEENYVKIEKICSDILNLQYYEDVVTLRTWAQNKIEALKEAEQLIEIQEQFNRAISDKDWESALIIYNGNPQLKKKAENNAAIRIVRTEIKRQKENLTVVSSHTYRKPASEKITQSQKNESANQGKRGPQTESQKKVIEENTPSIKENGKKKYPKLTSKNLK